MSSNGKPEEQQQKKHEPGKFQVNAMMEALEVLIQSYEELQVSAASKKREAQQKMKESFEKLEDTFDEFIQRPPPTSVKPEELQQIHDTIRGHIRDLRRSAGFPEYDIQLVQQRVLEDLQAMFPRPVAVEKAQAVGQAQMLKNADDKASKSPSSDHSF
ncbi:hypothetical protein KCU77_g2397, partial [Aureobasidium melanogenum]